MAYTQSLSVRQTLLIGCTKSHQLGFTAERPKPSSSFCEASNSIAQRVLSMITNLSSDRMRSEAYQHRLVVGIAEETLR